MRLTPPEIDVQLGMEYYSTYTTRNQGRLRVRLEDFQVEEQIDLGKILKTDGIPLYKVIKKNIDTFHVARIISSIIHSKVSFSGLKDKKAVATQYFSPTSIRAACPPVISHAMLDAEIVQRISRPIQRRDLIANCFRIVIRETKPPIEDSVRATYEAAKRRILPNFFGYQRFGLRGPITHRIGKALVKKNFEEAVRLIVAEPRLSESSQAREARLLAREGKFPEALSMLTPGQDIERRVLASLVEKEKDYIAALRTVPIPVRRLFISAYQAHIFNMTLSMALGRSEDISRARPGDCWTEIAGSNLRTASIHGAKENPSEGSVHLVQIPGLAFRDYGSRFDRLEVDVMRAEEVTPIEFYIREANELSSEGGFRRACLLSRDESYEIRGKDLSLSFVLGPGEYATALLREILKPDDPNLAGF
jgi:tRNA pseudouridine13 synthase